MRARTANLESPWSKQEARELSRQIKREAVLRTAVQFFKERGFRATSLDDVAARLNVKTFMIYRLFSRLKTRSFLNAYEWDWSGWQACYEQRTAVAVSYSV